MKEKNLKKRVLAFVMSVLSAAAVTFSAVPFKASAGQLLGQTNFEEGIGLPWHVCESAPGEMDFSIDNGVYSITIVNPGGASNGGEDRWDCQFRHRGLKITSGNTYKVSFEITASNDCTYYTKIGDMDEPFEEDWHGEPDDSQHESFWDVKPLQAGVMTKVEGTFTAKRTSEVEWAFHIGGDSVPAGTVFTFDNMSLECTNSDTDDYKPAEEWQRSNILTNQLGYFCELKKTATLLSNENGSVNFDLKDSSGKSVYSGKSEGLGEDKDSGDMVHKLDFSDFNGSGTYYLEAEDGSVSREFSIGGGELYSYMLYDSLNYFYQNRSGIEIESKYIVSGDSSSLARAAGHTTDNAEIEQTWGYSASSGTQDVSGGWYDAGDHGKYVVNGGISLWTMQNQYENALLNGDTSAYDDGTMNIPESGNGFPDLLDEARWEMEWMFKMMVQDGECKDMVYHKVHDKKWTALGLTPAEDMEERIIKPPTTTATLNMAACAAQAYRLWKELDPTFAETCLSNAKSAYEAAKKHPDMFAPLDESVGGGPYGDTSSDDEFYWAACELFAATDEEQYLKDAKSSDYYLKLDHELKSGEDAGTIGTVDWGNVYALGSYTLALYKDKIGGDADTIVKNISDTADYYVDLTNTQGYGQPYGQSQISYANEGTGYVWGSNSFVLNNSIAMAYAYQLTGDEKYLGGAVSGMDYILGRNPVDYSYVTGYGTHAVQYPHHRFWANQISPDFPSAPNGVVVGGPNSGMEDPWVQGSGWKPGEIAPAKCYLDNIEAWSVNECTINWNTPLSWLTGFLAQQGGGIVVVNGSSDSNANKVNQAASENPAAGNYKADSHKANKKVTKSSGDYSWGSWGIVPVLIAAVALVIGAELVICGVSKSKKKKKSQ